MYQFWDTTTKLMDLSVLSIIGKVILETVPAQGSPLELVMTSVFRDTCNAGTKKNYPANAKGKKNRTTSQFPLPHFYF